MLIPINLIKHVNKTIEPKTVSNFFNLKKRETSKSFFNDEAMVDQLQETMQTYIYEFSQDDSPYNKFYYNLMYRFNSFKIDDKNIFSMSIDRLGYKKYLYEKLLEKYQDILVEPIKWEMIWDNIYETISRNFMNEFKNELDEVTEKYKNDHSSIKSISEISKKEFEENILDKINLHNIFDYTLFKLFQSEEWEKVDPKYTEKTKHLSQKNPVVFKKIMQMITFRTTQNNNENWKLYQLIVINRGKYGYIGKDVINPIVVTWARQHKIGDVTKKSLPQEWIKDKAKQQAALKALPKIKKLGFKPSAGIVVPHKISDISNSKLRKYEIENIKETIDKYNQDQTTQLKSAQDLTTTTYANDKTNFYGTLTDDMKNKLNDARIAVVDKSTYDAFITLFNKNKTKYKANYAADTKRVVEIDDLGFEPKVDRLGTFDSTNATKEDYKKYNAQITKFNNDQKQQLTTAQTLAKNQYTFANANENKNLDAVKDLKKLDNARIAIDKKSAYDAFLNVFRKLKAKDFSNNIINKFDFLTARELKTIDTLRLAVKDKSTYDKFIAKKDVLIKKDQNRQTAAIGKSDKLAFKELGFAGKIIKLVKPVINISVKKQIKDYTDNVIAFNDEQKAKLDGAIKETKTTYANDKANIHKTLSETTLTNLATTRAAVKDKATFEVFKKQFIFDQNDDAKNFKNLQDKAVKAEDKGFTSPTGFGKPKMLKGDATAKNYEVYNQQMKKFNQNQDNQLLIAITLSTSKYANKNANQYNHVTKNLGVLKILRDQIKTNFTNNIFVKNFNKLRGQDLKAEASIGFSNDKINALGYLITDAKNEGYDFLGLDDLRNKITNEATFEKFIIAKDELVHRDISRQKNVIVVLRPFSTLGFDPIIVSVVRPKVGISTKTDIEAYQEYIKKFNTEQGNSLATAQKTAKTALNKVVEDGYLKKQYLKKLGNPKKIIVDKDSYDKFMSKFQTLVLSHLKLVANKDFSNRKINALGYLINIKGDDYDFKKLDDLRDQITNEATYEKFIKAKDELLALGIKKQKVATDALKPLNNLGFKSSKDVKNKKVDTPEKGISTKTDIDAYVDYAKVFNQDQAAKLENVKKEAKDIYANDKTNIHKTLSSTILTNLDTARGAIKDKTTFETFKKLFKFDQDSDVKNFKDIQDRIVKADDKGFASPVGFGKPEILKEGATAINYEAYNQQMNKFNQNQDKQLSIAITLSTSKYADKNANQYSHLDKEFNALDVLRKVIKNRNSNDDFVTMFKKLRGQDLKAEATINFSNAKINVLGYLESNDFNVAKIGQSRVNKKYKVSFSPFNDESQGNNDFTQLDALRGEIEGESTYKIFIEEKDRLVALDKQRQKTAISSLGDFNDLDFSSSTPKVAPPKIGISKKEEIIKYAQYIIDFNNEQSQLLQEAKNLAKTKYAINKLGENQHQTGTDAKKNLVSVRNKIVNKKTFDIFVAKFQTLRLVNLKATTLDFSDNVINKFGYLEQKDFNDSNIKQLRKDVEDKDTYQDFIREKDRLVALDKQRQETAIKALNRTNKNLGFKSTITLVDPITESSATKKQIEAYDQYIKVYSAEQTKLLKQAKDDAKKIYTNKKANEYSHLETKDLTKLDNLRTKIKTKVSNDKFIDKFNELQLLDKRIEASDNFSDKIINKHKNLTKKELDFVGKIRKFIGQKGGYKLLKDVAIMMNKISKEREALGIAGNGATLPILNPDGEGAPDPNELEENSTQKEVMEYNYKVAAYNERQRMLKQQSIKTMKGRVAKLYADKKPVIPFSKEEQALLDKDNDSIKSVSTLAEVTRAVDKFEQDYNRLLTRKAMQLQILVEEVKEENKISNFGFTLGAPKLPILSSKGGLTKGKLNNYKKAVTAFNLYQTQQRNIAKSKLNKLIIDKEHVAKEKIDTLKKVKKDVEEAMNSERFAKLYNNFVDQYAGSAGGTPVISQTKKLLIIAIPSVGGLLIIFLIGVIFKLKRSKKMVNNFSSKKAGRDKGQRVKKVGGEIEKWGNEDFEGWS